MATTTTPAAGTGGGAGASASSSQPWTCQYRGCKSKKSQIKELRARLPTGYPHDEDPNLRVCTVCRRLPLDEQVSAEQHENRALKETQGNYSKSTIAQFLKFSVVANALPDVSPPPPAPEGGLLLPPASASSQVLPLDEDTVRSVIDEVEDLEQKGANELFSVLIYYAANHGNQLAKALVAKILTDGFPWEMSLFFELVNDLVMNEVARNVAGSRSGTLAGTASTVDTPKSVDIPGTPTFAGALSASTPAAAPLKMEHQQPPAQQSYRHAFGVLFPKLFQLAWDRVNEIPDDDKTVNKVEEQKRIMRVVNQWRELGLWGLASLQSDLSTRIQLVRNGTVFKVAGKEKDKQAAEISGGAASSSTASAGAVKSGKQPSSVTTILSVNIPELQKIAQILDTVQQEEDKEEERDAKRRKVDDESAKKAEENRKSFIDTILAVDFDPGAFCAPVAGDSGAAPADDAATLMLAPHLEILGFSQDEWKKGDVITQDRVNKVARKLMFKAHPDKNKGVEPQKCTDAMTRITNAKEALLEKLDPAAQKKKKEIDASQVQVLASSNVTVKTKLLCRFPGCSAEVCSQCAHGCCRSHITHCHSFARQNPGLRCFFHPPPRENAVNAVLVNGRWQQKR